MSNADLADFADKRKHLPHRMTTEMVRDAVAWVFVLALLIVVVPKFESIFEDFGVELSTLMILIVRAAHSWPVLLGMVVALLAVDSIVRETLANHKVGSRASRTWSMLMIAMPTMIVLAMGVALGTALTGLLLKLGG